MLACRPAGPDGWPTLAPTTPTATAATAAATHADPVPATAAQAVAATHRSIASHLRSLGAGARPARLARPCQLSWRTGGAPGLVACGCGLCSSGGLLCPGGRGLSGTLLLRPCRRLPASGLLCPSGRGGPGLCSGASRAGGSSGTGGGLGFRRRTGLASVCLAQVTASGFCLAAIGFSSRGAIGIAEALGNPGVAIGNVAAMPGIVTPCAVGDVGAIELVVAIDVDVGPVAPPIDVTPNRRSDGDGGCKREYAATGEAARIPIEWLIVRVGPVAIDDPRIIKRHRNVFVTCR